MSLEIFQVTDENPNDNCGGGGCACSEEKVKDCTGPFVVFTAVETDFVPSPYIVIGSRCMAKAYAGLSGEIIVLGHSPEPVDVTYEEDPDLFDAEEIPRI